jgi:hypothetical protein
MIEIVYILDIVIWILFVFHVNFLLELNYENMWINSVIVGIWHRCHTATCTQEQSCNASSQMVDYRSAHRTRTTITPVE